MMGFWWSRRSGGGPPRADCCESLCGGWVGPTVLLCIYGFCSLMRPLEPFMTEFLTGSYKNFTTQQVTMQIFPVWTYSNLFLLIPVLLLTDFLRYKPVIILQGLCFIVSFLLILFGTGIHTVQCAFFIYSMATTSDVAYFSYIYSVVQPQHYQRVTSYARSAVLVGYATACLLAQLLVSLGGVSLYILAVITLVSLCVALLISLFLPMPKRSLFFKETHRPKHEGSGKDTQSNSESCLPLSWMETSRTAVRRAGRAVRRKVLDCKECYSSMAVLFFCIWYAAGRCGFYQIVGYVQILWAHSQPQQNFTAYNGGVDAIATLSGAVASITVGHVSLDWTVWGELVLGGFSVLIAGGLYLMDLTHNIWLCYSGFILFKMFYMQLITICTFQIARKLKREHYALVFGINSFVGTVLQSVLTAIVINTKSLQLPITSQFFIYASYFAVIALLFLVRGAYTVHNVKRPSTDTPAEPSDSLPEVSRV